MTEEEREAHEKLVLQNVGLENELENLRFMYNTALKETAKEQGKCEALHDVTRLLISKFEVRGY